MINESTVSNRAISSILSKTVTNCSVILKRVDANTIKHLNRTIESTIVEDSLEVSIIENNNNKSSTQSSLSSSNDFGLFYNFISISIAVFNSFFNQESEYKTLNKTPTSRLRRSLRTSATPSSIERNQTFKQTKTTKQTTEKRKKSIVNNGSFYFILDSFLNNLKLDDEPTTSTALRRSLRTSAIATPTCLAKQKQSKKITKSSDSDSDIIDVTPRNINKAKSRNRTQSESPCTCKRFF